MIKDFFNYYQQNESSYKKGVLLERITCYYLTYHASNSSDYQQVVLWSNHLA